MEELFRIENFNLISDEENYYFFRALNMADNQDLEKGIIVDENGKIVKIRTDRERCEEGGKEQTPKYDKNEPISLEQVYDHVKVHYRKDTNCISLSSNSNVAISYGRNFYKDRYVMIKVPKKEFGKNVINAGQYMLEEIEKKVNAYMETVNRNKKITEAFHKIENSQTTEEVRNIIKKRYTSKEKLNPNKAKPRKGIQYQSPVARVSDYQTLNEEQLLEKNKLIAKLSILEKIGNMPPMIPHTINNNRLIQTVGRAFASLELIHYGNIEKEEIIDVPKELVNAFALLQRIEDQDVTALKRDVINFMNQSRHNNN